MPISIQPYEEAVLGPLSTYDLAFEFKDTVPASGALRFSVTGPDLEHLLAGDHDWRPMSLVIGLSCIHVGAKGERRFDKRDARWRLVLKTDPATKLLIVDDQQKGDFKCSRCRKTARGRRWDCLDCSRVFFLCDKCFVNSPEHPAPRGKDAEDGVRTFHGKGAFMRWDIETQ